MKQTQVSTNVLENMVTIYENIGDVEYGINVLRKNNKKFGEADDQLKGAIQKIYKYLGFGEAENEESLDRVLAVIAGIEDKSLGVDGLKENEGIIHKEAVREMEAKSLNAEDLKVLVAEYEVSLEKDKTRIASRLKHDYGVDINRLINRQKEIREELRSRMGGVEKGEVEEITRELVVEEVVIKNKLEETIGERAEETAKKLTKVVEDDLASGKLHEAYVGTKAAEILRKEGLIEATVEDIIDEVEDVAVEIMTEEVSTKIATEAMMAMGIDDNNGQLVRVLKERAKEDLELKIDKLDNYRPVQVITSRGVETKMLSLEDEVATATGFSTEKAKVASKMAELVAEKYTTSHLKEVAEIKSHHLTKGIVRDFQKANPNMEPGLLGFVRSMARTTANLPDSGIEIYRNQIAGKEGKDQVAFTNLSQTTSLLKSGKGLWKLLEIRQKLVDGGVQIPKNGTVGVVDTMAKIMEKDPGFGQMIKVVQGKFEIFQRLTDPSGLAWKIATRTGFDKWILERFGAESMAKKGFEMITKGGLEAGLKTWISTTATSAATKLAATGGSKVLISILGAAAGTTGVGLIVTAAIWLGQIAWELGKKAINFVKDGVSGFLKTIGIDLPDIKRFFSEDLGLGDKLGSAAGNVAKAGLMVVGMASMMIGPMMTAAAAAVGPILILVFGGMFAFQFLQSTMISSMVMPSNKAVGGGGSTLSNPLPTWDPQKPIPEGCPSVWPVNSYVITQGSYAAGCSHQNIRGEAIDIAVNSGSQVVAAHKGTVRTGYDDGYGYFVDIKASCNGQEFTTRYGHFSSFSVSNGDSVNAGDPIGVSDNTGRSTGPHLHFEVAEGKLGSALESYFGVPSTLGCCNADNGVQCPTK